MVLQDFEDAVNYLHNPKNGNPMITNTAVHLFESKGIRVSVGDRYAIKECVDPLTDKILFSRKYASDDDIKKVAHDVFNVKIDHQITFFKKT